ncbi:Protein phosphatase methylesterase 1 [Massospora cicadina]|nr:Protein phosphatase methylesterase 1 [Massospora cicadina]
MSNLHKETLKSKLGSVRSTEVLGDDLQTPFEFLTPTDPTHLQGNQEVLTPTDPTHLQGNQEVETLNFPSPTPPTFYGCNPNLNWTTGVPDTPEHQLGGAGNVRLPSRGRAYGVIVWASGAVASPNDGGACCVIAFDARGHGSLSVPSVLILLGNTHNQDESDFSIDLLVSDLHSVVQKIVPVGEVVLVGHSMGGAVVAKAAATGAVGGRPLAGTVVIDVVEGTALAALAGMDRVLESRPKAFQTPEAAVKWAISSRTLCNPASARLSIPSQVIRSASGWRWRIDLAVTRPYWGGWFTGLSSNFLGARSPKLLLLAGTDRLDKTLMVAHMQGKFQLEVRPATSHSIQEDDPIGTINP